MALLKIHTLGIEQAWALWQIAESEEELSSASTEVCPAEIIHPQKRLEWLSARLLIKTLLNSFGLHYAGLSKDDFGKPFLNEQSHHISLSHSYPFVVAQIDKDNPVGIDIEQPKEKLIKIAPRLFSQEEVQDAGIDLTKLCIYWCAKEAMYKIYGKRNLLFSNHLLIQSFNLATKGMLTGKITLPGEETIIRLEYLVMENFVVVFTSMKKA